MVYSILTEAKVRPSVSPKKPEVTDYQVVWDINQDLKGWTTFVNMDIVGSWGGFLFGTKRTESGGFIGPSSDFSAVDALINDRIFFRMKYDKHPKSQGASTFGKIQWTTEADPIFGDDKSVTFDLFADGRWHFYELNMGEVPSWVGNINRVRFFPCEDGFFNDEFFLSFFEIGTNAFDFSFEEEAAGSPGFAQGAVPLTGSVTIEKDVNDKLIVNIDDYGDVQITLTPQTSQPLLIARDISLQLGKVGVGGYTRADAFITDGELLRIESGTRAPDSSVEIKSGPNSAAETLGFTDAVGFFIGTSEAGSAPDSQYEPLSDYRPTTLEVLSLFDNDDDLPAFSLDPQQPIVQAGNINFDVVNQRLAQDIVLEGRDTGLEGFSITQEGSLDGSSKTFIDLNHPFTDEGKVDKIFMNGIPNRDGSSKWKIFRPRLDGTLTLVAEGPIAEKTFTDDPNGGLVSSPVPDVFSADLSTSNIAVRRGDLLGIYNVGLHAGAGNTIKPDALYYEIEGDVTGTLSPPPPSGAGETGLAIYAEGAATKSRAVIDIDLRRRLNIDRVRVKGIEDTRDLEYNLGIAGSTVYNADVSGEHTICYQVTPTVRDCFTRQNQAFNIQALNDDVLTAENGDIGFGDGGVGGIGGADVTGSTYFYVNGDGEFLGTFEFEDQGPERFGFFRDPLGIDCFFSNQTPRLDKPIGKVVMYFKDKKNQRAWQLEYLVGQGGKGGNGSKPGFSLIPAETFRSVRVDDKLIEPFLGIPLKEDHVSLLVDNPVLLDVIAADGTRNPQRGVDFENSVAELGGVNFGDQAVFLEFQWNRFEWSFDTIRTPAIRWYSDFHWSTKISEMQIFAVSESNESLGDNVQVLFSADGETFTTAEIVNANEKESEYKIGNSPQFMRLIVRPVLKTFLTDVQIDFEEDQVCFGDEGRITKSTALKEARVGSVGASTPLKITNNTGQTADLILDIPEDIETARQLLYFNQLNNQENIQSPQVGPPGRVDFTPDKTLKEQSSVTVNSKAYGLLSLVSGTEGFRSNNLAINGGFETGTLEGWNVEITKSGTLDFQIPRVDDFSDSATSSIQTGDFSFGVSQHSVVPSQDSQFAGVAFKIGQVHDLSDFVDGIDQGFSTFEFGLDYAAYGTEANPTIRVYGSPTLSGALEPPGTVVSSGYGSNLLSELVGTKSSNVGNPDVGNVQYDATINIKQGTRFIRTELDVDISSEESIGGNSGLIFHMDGYSAFVNTPAITTAKWYKSYFTGQGDFGDASFVPVTSGSFVTVTGSHHWYQPASQSAQTAPEAGQTQGFDFAFTQDRNKGVQSFSRMRPTDPGILGARWVGEKKIAGIRVAHSDNTGPLFAASHYPRFWQIEVLKTKSELGGQEPDVNNNSHFKVVRQVSSLIKDAGPAQLEINSNVFGGASSKITTWIFDEPVSTEGIRLVFTLNCDVFERQNFPDFSSFNAFTGCPDNTLFGTDFVTTQGIYVSMVTPLESLGRTSLPVDDVPDRELTDGINAEGGDGGTVYTAVDLGRHFDVETDSDLFELVAQTISQTAWPTNAVFSGDDTDDPNLVSWAGSSNFARWIRFSAPSSPGGEFEQEVRSFTGGLGSVSYGIENLPQGILTQARVYPRLQTAGIPLEGPNHLWKDLGDILTDNRTTTFINYSDYPIICLDLGRDYLLKQSSSAIVQRRELFTPGASSDSDDKNYWQTNNDDAFAYSSKSFRQISDPSRVKYTSFGAAIPTTTVRWVAVRGIGNLLQDDASGPKEYNFETIGGILSGVNFAPENPEILTENSNWFTTSTSALRDISTFDTSLGRPFSIQEDIDYGSNGPADQLGTFGDPYFVWDGVFDIADDDFWGIGLRDPNSGLDIGGNEFPHYVWRVFRDPHRGDILTRSVKAVKILGYDEDFHPKDFEIQSLDSPDADPNSDLSWTTINEGTFIGINTYNQGLGFTHILPEPLETSGIRLLVNDSEYVDDTVTAEVNELGQFNQAPIDRGPQTRIVSVVVYEEIVEEANLVGTIETDHARGASITSTTQVPERGAVNMIDGSANTFFQSTGFQETITLNLPFARTINRFEWEMDQRYAEQFQLDPISSNAPATFRLKSNENIVFETVLEENGFSGLTFSGTLSPPVIADKFVFEVDEPQGINTDASSIVIHSLRLIEETQQISPLVTVEDTFDRRPGGTNLRSSKISYAENASSIANVYLDGIDAGNDGLFSERDFFTFWLKINDVSLLDTNFGSFRLGNDRDTFYSWRVSDLNLKSGWNQVRLQFSQADNNTPIEFQSGPNFDPATGESRVDFVTADQVISTSVDGVFSQRVERAPGIRFFEAEFRGTGGSQKLELTIDDMRFIRNRFEDKCRFTPSLYLNNSETFSIFLDGLDLSVGTVEFWFQPDWDQTARIDRLRNILPSIFKITRPDGKFMSFFYRPSEGFVTVINAGDEVLQFKSDVSKYLFQPFDNIHVALTWDVFGRMPPTGATMRLWINGKVVYATNRVWSGLREGGATVMFGGEVGQAVAATPHNETAITFTPVPTLPQTNTASSWALLENIKIYNYAKTNFSDINQRDISRSQLVKPSDMLQISLDDVNFYSSGSDNLPLVVQNVPPDGTEIVYMRSNIPKDLTGDERRDASLLVRWKTPLVQCD